jgi:hypothetical protein
MRSIVSTVISLLELYDSIAWPIRETIHSQFFSSREARQKNHGCNETQAVIRCVLDAQF